MDVKKAIFVTAILGATIGVIVYLNREFTKLYNSCYTIAGGVIHTLGINKVKITLVFKIVNKSDISVKLQNMVFDIFVNDMFVTKITRKEKQKLLSHDSTIFNLDFQFNPKELLKAGVANIEPILFDKEKLVIKIKGKIDAVAGIVKMKEFPIEEKITLKELLTPSPNPPKC